MNSEKELTVAEARIELAHSRRVYMELMRPEWNHGQMIRVYTIASLNRWLSNDDYTINRIWVGADSIPVGRA